MESPRALSRHLETNEQEGEGCDGSKPEFAAIQILRGLNGLRKISRSHQKGTSTG